MSAKITIKDVQHIAKLVNLPIQSDEAENLAPQLSQAADYVNVLSELYLNNTSETSQVTGLTNVFRQDEIEPSLTQEEALKNAKNTYEGYFVVPAVIEKE
jgi:aspartyl-tRNA(Asn)/glutamyl-tRNA(Gln) amidotransferase subunit C